MSAVSANMAVGTEFAGYRITGMLGRGGMSTVYAAEHIRLGRPAALKVLSPALAADDAFRARFIRESQLAAGLDHPNIIAIYDAGQADGLLYIAMRFVRGDDLGTLVEREGPLSLPRALFVLEQVASALDQAHEQGLIHRDVKPANILVERPSDRAYLTDFGVVKETSSRGLTQTGYFLGTFEYAAPEQIEGGEIDGRVDVYALGCVLYECLSGEAPFAGETEGAVIHAHLVEPPPKLTAKRGDLPAGLNTVVATAMAKAKGDRYPSCGELLRAFRAAVFSGTPPGQREVSAQPPAEAAPATVLAPPEETPRVEGAREAAPPTTGPPAPPTGDAPPASEPSAAPAAPRRARTVELTGRRITTGVAAVLVLIAAAVAAAVLVTRGGSSPSAATSSTGSGGAPVVVGLQGVVPKLLLRDCNVVTPTNGASQTAACTAPKTGGSTFWPDTWSFSLYSSTASALNAYNALRVQNGIGKDFGKCDRTSWAGEGEWLHNPEPGAQPKVGGRRFCYFQGNVAVIVWLHKKLGQPSHIDMLGVARASGSDHFNLYGWYAFWHHTVGKCLAPGCVARLK